ncbi:helix-turn-helix domain-containing protein [Kribbella italica]|uniref:Helix-turn-helix domain-containing protein n=1 Tax=Kribbella italica TaxID=1540520 RepID=A0A7W9MSP4_9ACTN|nr:helix-turn-helix domain-containing protein [Kribbella italica]MBB5834377.1 hypothetical protein [Kribbella italica]
MTKVAGTTDSAGFGIVPRHLRGKLKANEIAVYVALSWRTDAEGGSFPSHATIAEEAGCSVSTVQRALKRLQELGLVVWQSRSRENGAQTSNRYRLDLYGAGLRAPRSQGPTPSVTGTDEREPREREPVTTAAARAADGSALPSALRRKGKPTKQETPTAESLMISETEEEAERRHERERAESTIGTDAVEGVETACARAGVKLTRAEKVGLYVLLATEPVDVRELALYLLEDWNTPDHVPKPGPMMAGRVRAAIEQAKRSLAVAS